ncbi:calcium-binding protein [Arenibacterium sp. CAU 1754]
MSDPILNLDPDYKVSHVFSTADIVGTFDGLKQGDVEPGETPVIDFTADPKVTKEGVNLYPINSEFGFLVTDFDGAIERDFEDNPEYEEGWAGDLKGEGGEQVGLVVSDSPTETFKTPAAFGTWLAGIGGSTVKASTEHYSVMQNVLSDQRYPGDPLAEYPLDDRLIVVGGEWDGMAVEDVIPLITDKNGDGVVDIKDVLTPNESTIVENIAVSNDYSVTLKDDGKLLYRWGNTVKRPIDVRIEAELPLPDEWKEPDANSDLLPLFKITQAELATQHTITNNPNDQIRPEDFENESAIGQLPSYEVLPDGKWVSVNDYYAGDGTFYPAGTVLKDPELAKAAANSDLGKIGALSSDLMEGFTNAWYTTMDREPFVAVLQDDGTYLIGPRWRLQPDKYGQDLPSVVIPLDPALPPPPTNDEVKYEVGTDTQTVINLLDWESTVSPLSISAGWQMNSGNVSGNGMNMTENFDVTFYIKGDIKPATIYSTELLMDYEEITIHDADAVVSGAGEDDYLVGQGGNTFTGDAGSVERGKDFFVLSYGVIGNLAQIQTSTILDFEVGKDTIGLIDLNISDTNFDDLVTQTVDNGDLKISLGGFEVASLTGVTESLEFEDFVLINRNILHVAGSKLDDYLVGTDYDDFLKGKDGDDTILGLAGDDRLNGGDGDDTLDGGADNDVLIGGTGADTLIGGEGIDRALYIDATAAVTVDLLSGTGTGDEAEGDTLTGIEIVSGSDFDDTLIGDDGDNTLIGNLGDDTLIGNLGRDTLRGDGGADTLNGSKGIDTASYVTSAAAVTVNLGAGTATGGDATGDVLINIEGVDGSSFNDVLTGDAKGNYLDGKIGDDTLAGGDGDDVLTGGNGADALDGGAGVDRADYGASSDAVTVDLTAGTGLGGEAEGDTLTGIENVSGSKYGDTLTGDALGNKLVGQDGDDVLDGGAGDDVLIGGLGADLMVGGDGIDKVTYVTAGSGIIVDLELGAGTRGDADGDTLSSIENVVGSKYSDLIIGSADNNELSGLDGNDILDGGAGDDVLFGGDGNDQFVFNLGNDTLNGGAGDDTAFYDGVQADFTVVDNGGGSWSVTDIATGDIDTLIGIETLHFDDVDMIA